MNAVHILLTTDLSEGSLHAFDQVAELARTLDARITVLHVVRNQIRAVAPLGPGLPPLRIDPQEAAREAREQLTELTPRLGGVREVVVEAAIGQDVAKAIVDYAVKHSATFIAMSTHGHTGLSRLVLGSTAESVVRHSPLPVILYPLRHD